jgi:hypothetical protein
LASTNPVIDMIQTEVNDALTMMPVGTRGRLQLVRIDELIPQLDHQMSEQLRIISVIQERIKAR